jgi:flagellar M-ring protein FliF
MPNVQGLLGRLGGTRNVMIIAIGVIVTALVFGVSQWATRPEWVPLFDNVPLEASGVMGDKLTEAGIAFRLERGGAQILVQSADAARARVTLAREPLPSSGRPGLELFDKPTWGMTDFTQRINHRRAMEGELERTIASMDGVQSAKVHLAIEEGSVFRRIDTRAKASVQLVTKSGSRPSEKVVEGIAQLVANSVGGLEADHVVIVDGSGQALTRDGADTPTGLSSRQLAVQAEVEHYLEEKAHGLVSQIVGLGNARVQVSAAINFDKLERTVQAVDPEQQAIVTEQRAEITPSEGQQGAASSNVATSYETTKRVETFSGAIGNVKRLTVAVLVADKVPTPAAGDTGATATPVVPEPRTADELTRIESLVRSALGVDSARGDVVSVVSAPFTVPALPAVGDSVIAPPTIVARVQQFEKPLITLLACATALIIAVLTLKALKAPAPAALASGSATAALTAGGSNDNMALRDPMSDVADSDSVLTPAEEQPILLPPTTINPLREQAIATVDQRPGAAVKALRSWLRES